MINIQSAVIAHPYPLDRLSISQIINQQNPRTHITEVASVTELQKQLDHPHNIDLLLLDLALLDGTSLQPLKDLCSNYPTLKTVTISHHQQNIGQQLLRSLGVAGNISSKDCRQTVIHTLQSVAQDKCGFLSGNTATGARASAHASTICELSRQEQRVMDKLVKGLMNKEIADELKISPHTAKAHVRSILRKWNVNNRTQAILAHRQQMINSQQPIVS
ncbi:MAG: response regulator transcription factor [Amphritea sp.]